MNESSNKVSPKVLVPNLFLIALLVAQVVVTQEWSSGETFNSIAIVLQAITGYVTVDPARGSSY